MPFAALAFKVMADPYVGKLTYFRVYSGTLKTGSKVLNSEHRPPGAGRAASSRCTPTTARSARRSTRATSSPASASSRPPPATRCATRNAPIKLETIEFPEPVIAVSIEPKTKADQEKLGAALARLAEEDPTFQVRSDEETGQTLISGMGELHLEVIIGPAAARVQGRRERRPAAGRLPRDRAPAGGEDRRPLRAADGWPRSVRPRRDQPRAGARRGLRLRQQDQGRLDPVRVHPRGRAGHRGGARVRRARPATRWWTSA